MKQRHCSLCGRPRERQQLTAKRVMFTTMGNKWKTLKSRTVAWLCDECRADDPEWEREGLYESPGLVQNAPEVIS